MAISDDAIREIHGVKAVGEKEAVTLRERERYIGLETSRIGETNLTQFQARYLAAKLYRLARRIRQREDATDRVVSISSRETA